jgi:hypothetical protein
MVNERTRKILLTFFIICQIPDLWPARTQSWNNNQRRSLINLMAPHSNLNHIQTTITPLIAESSFEVCISRCLTFLGLFSINVPGTSQLNQGYSMPTMHRPVKYDKVRFLCLHHDISRDQPATRGLQSSHSTDQPYSCHTLAHICMTWSWDFLRF